MMASDGLGWPRMASDGLGWPRMASDRVLLDDMELQWGLFYCQ